MQKSKLQIRLISLIVVYGVYILITYISLDMISKIQFPVLTFFIIQIFMLVTLVLIIIKIISKLNKTKVVFCTLFMFFSVSTIASSNLHFKLIKNSNLLYSINTNFYKGLKLYGNQYFLIPYLGILLLLYLLISRQRKH